MGWRELLARRQVQRRVAVVALRAHVRARREEQRHLALEPLFTNGATKLFPGQWFSAKVCIPPLLCYSRCPYHRLQPCFSCLQLC